MSAPEDNPMDDVQPTKEEWEEYEATRFATPQEAHDDGPDAHPSQCAKCDQQPCGFDYDGTPFCAEHYRARKRIRPTT